jgi:hypothetical protein
LILNFFLSFDHHLRILHISFFLSFLGVEKTLTTNHVGPKRLSLIVAHLMYGGGTANGNTEILPVQIGPHSQLFNNALQRGN